MKRSRKTNRAKPLDMTWAETFRECAKLFQEANWFQYFEKIDGHHTEVSYGFAQGLEKETVSFNTLRIELSRELIAEAIGIADEGEFWFKKVSFRSRRCHLLLIQRISCYPMLLKIGVRGYIYRILN